MKELNRETTTAKRFPAAFNEPSSPRREGSGGSGSAERACLLCFSVGSSLRGGLVFQPARSVRMRGRNVICP